MSKHDEYTIFLDDKEYEDAEHWMELCTCEYTEFIIDVNEYGNTEKKETPVIPHEELNEVLHEELHEVPAVTSNTGNDPSINENVPQQEVDEIKDGENSSVKSTSPKPLVLKHERPKLPQFLGDIKKYFIFKVDFKHAIESQCSERDTITILRSCLGPEPSKLVKGISTDLKTMWQYLDQNYGDPGVISDTVTADLERFKPIQEVEDHKFCDLVNLVRRSYNILREIKRPQDINNRHVISLIERKMAQDDIKVWATTNMIKG